MANFHEFFSVRVECELAVWRSPDERAAFIRWCTERIMRECAEREIDFEPDRFDSMGLRRDPEGPGVGMMPLLLRYGYWWPELEPL